MAIGDSEIQACFCSHDPLMRSKVELTSNIFRQGLRASPLVQQEGVMNALIASEVLRNRCSRKIFDVERGR